MSASRSSDSVFIIAEAGVNHNGSVDIALKLVDAAADAGADAVKFQTFKAEKVVTASAPKAEYQVTNTGRGGTQIEMIRALELTDDEFRRLAQHAASRGIEFMSTAFDVDSLRFLVNGLGVRRVKIPSGEVTNAQLLWEAAATGLDVILSTGMTNLEEISDTLAVIAHGLMHSQAPASLAECTALAASPEALSKLRERVMLLHCTTAYPTPDDDINLRAMATMRERFGLPVGLSDHSDGIAVAMGATALGAVAIEKHFTLDRTLPGPDHLASLEPPDLKAMVEGVRSVSRAMGSAAKEPAPSEQGNITVARRSLVAARDIRRGERFRSNMLDAKRPGTGLSPMRIWDFLGKAAQRDYQQDELIDE